MKPKASNLVWMDLEMTGLNPDKDRIIEIATIITDKNLNIIAEGPAIAIHHSERILNLMDEWNWEHHGKSGLVEKVRKSKISTCKAEQITLDFIKQYVPEKKSPLCGNSICQDRRFLFHYMPTLEDYFHYRNLDVSVLKILARRWYKDIKQDFTKKSKHMALSDIHDSIDEMKFYREELLRKK